MTPKESVKKLQTVSQICFWAHGLFGVIAEQTRLGKKHLLKEEFVENIYNMSLKQIAKVLDTVDPKGGMIPKEFRDILK